jgi:hypothetical protein
MSKKTSPEPKEAGKREAPKGRTLRPLTKDEFSEALKRASRRTDELGRTPPRTFEPVEDKEEAK